MKINILSLVGRFNGTCRTALEEALDEAMRREHYEIDLEHLILRLVDAPGGDISRILARFEINPDRLKKDLDSALARLKTGNTRKPSLSPRIPQLFQAAWLLASLEYAPPGRSGHLLTALVEDGFSAHLSGEISPELEKIRAQYPILRREFLDIVRGGSEDESGADSTGAAAATPPAPKNFLSGAVGAASLSVQNNDDRIPGSRYPVSLAQGDAGIGAAAAAAAAGKAPEQEKDSTGTEFLDRYTEDLTAKARSGAVDPVVGRDAEIRSVIDVLTRRRQNNPILTGEAGVGKTAIVEGLALRVAAGDVPLMLRDVSIRTLDIILLSAGATQRGEFEGRLKSVIEEAQANPDPVILFIDEAHTLIGAGGAAGTGDAANILKPALARGELRTIAATTLSEYKKYFERDAALARRFQVVKVEEPGEENACAMLRAIAPKMEAHHGVKILNEAVEAAVKLSTRYVTGRQLPDKAVSILDTAAAKSAGTQMDAMPAVVDAARVAYLAAIEKLRFLEKEKNEDLAGGSGECRRDEKLVELFAEADRLLGEFNRLNDQWGSERRIIGEIAALRSVLPHTPENQSEAARKILELKAVQQTGALLFPEVDAAVVASVVSEWTGIPVGKMGGAERSNLLKLESILGDRVCGQDSALRVISERIRASKSGLTDPQRPVGVFLLVGTSGVGKTETALALADAVYGGERNLITINMTEYQEKHTVSNLKGAPPGYVGFGQGGVMTEAVRRRPYSVLLLDEAEKAHPDVLELFYQIFDKGKLEDGEGREIDFKNCIILLTSNAASGTIMDMCGGSGGAADDHSLPSPDAIVEAVRPELLESFKPALLGRMTIAPYYPISSEMLRTIIRLQLGKIGERVRARSGSPNAVLTWDESVEILIADQCTDRESGARAVHNILNGKLLPLLSREFLSGMEENDQGQIGRMHLTVGENGEFGICRD